MKHDSILFSDAKEGINEIRKGTWTWAGQFATWTSTTPAGCRDPYPSRVMALACELQPVSFSLPSCLQFHLPSLWSSRFWKTVWSPTTTRPSRWSWNGRRLNDRSLCKCAKRLDKVDRLSGSFSLALSATEPTAACMLVGRCSTRERRVARGNPVFVDRNLVLMMRRHPPWTRLDVCQPHSCRCGGTVDKFGLHTFPAATAPAASPDMQPWKMSSREDSTLQVFLHASSPSTSIEETSSVLMG